MNHSWGKIPDIYIHTDTHKQQRCKKCGVVRRWYGGPYQAWKYVKEKKYLSHDGRNLSSFTESWDRPECRLITAAKAAQ